MLTAPETPATAASPIAPAAIVPSPATIAMPLNSFDCPLISTPFLPKKLASPLSIPTPLNVLERLPRFHFLNSN